MRLDDFINVKCFTAVYFQSHLLCKEVEVLSPTLHQQQGSPQMDIVAALQDSWRVWSQPLQLELLFVSKLKLCGKDTEPCSLLYTGYMS